MALSELEAKNIERAAGEFMNRRRPPAHLRGEVDLGYRISGQSVELFEARPRWDDRSETIEMGIAKATYVKRTGTWKVYWQRADFKWHRYEPAPEASSIREFLALVDADDHGCFFG